jgi:hypothetical protein
VKSFRSMLFLLLLAFVTLSCSKDDSNIDPHLQDFTCTVDYVELKDNSSAKIKFDILFNGEEESFIVNENYKFSNDIYSVGDELVNIDKFIINGNQATFNFYYGSNLGDFCKNIFNAIPPHNHDPFGAEADKTLSDKGVGRWKIRKKTRISN